MAYAVSLWQCIRHPLAEYLRQCGYQVYEATDADEARKIIAERFEEVYVVLVANAPGESGFALATWVRKEHPHIKVVLAGTVTAAAEKAGDLCEEGPKLSKPYDHQLVLNYIRRLIAARDRQR
ncbi:MAG TPA: response regulator [Roseiarcus sp.]|nr:response regulator [Roseiarcus sp.]